MTAFFQLTGINRSNQITGSVFNTIFLTVRSCVCPTRSCKLIAGCSLWTGGPFISLFLPSFPPFQAAPSFWLIIPPPPLQKKPPACRRRFLAVYSSNLVLSVPNGFLQNRPLKPESKPKWFIAKAKQSQRSSTRQEFSYEKHKKILLLGNCVRLSVRSHDSYRTWEYILPCFSHFQHQINEPSGKIQLQSRTWPVVVRDP